jgi:molybdopterin/thiamine biosynthesis adenylyltransferase/rhodanese-related sulfurtransferase
MSFTQAELNRYARHFVLPEFGMEGQKKLKASSVLVVGAGGLGCPLLLYLSAAGVGRIGIVDDDVVDESNLQRQVLYTVDDLGQSKAATAKKKLLALNPHIQVDVYQERFLPDNALELVSKYDIVADGTDNFPTRYLVNDACVLSDKINVYASIFRFEGQVSVFNYLNEDGTRGPNYRDIFPDPPPPDLVPNCAEGGVLGVLPGIIGSIQANEVIKVLTGIGEPLSGRLFLFDTAGFSTRTLKIRKNPKLEIKDLSFYEEYCMSDQTHIKEIDVSALKKWMAEGEDFQLIDVREPYEYEVANMGGELIPLGEVLQHADRIDRNKKVVIHCRVGGRSAEAIEQLERQFGFTNLYNLKGGIEAWEHIE